MANRCRLLADQHTEESRAATTTAPRLKAGHSAERRPRGQSERRTAGRDRHSRGREATAAYLAHNQDFAGSIPAPAIR